MTSYTCKLVALAAGMLGLALAASDAHAQFVCGGSTTGADPSTGGLSTAVSGSVACGAGVTASGENSFAAGLSTAAIDKVEASGKRSIAIGIGSLGSTIAKGTESIAIGTNAFAGGDAGIAIGSLSSSGDGKDNVAIGGFINPTFNNTTVLGGTALANGSNSVVIGQFAGGNDTANNAVVIGQGASAKGDNTTVVGQNAKANFAGSAAFGQGATTTRANQQMFGTTDNTYTMPGITSAASQAAQTGTPQLVTSDAGGNLAARSFASLGLASTTDITNINNQITGINSQISGLHQRDRELANGIAISMAVAQPVLLSGQSFGLRVGWGNFDSSNAVGISGAGVLSRGYAGPTSSAVLDAGIGVGTDVNVVGGRAGVTFGW